MTVYRLGHYLADFKIELWLLSNTIADRISFAASAGKVQDANRASLEQRIVLQRSRGSLPWSSHGDESRKRRSPHCPKHLPPLVCTTCTRRFGLPAVITHDGSVVRIRFREENIQLGLVRHSLIAHKAGEQLRGQVTSGANPNSEISFDAGIPTGKTK